MNGSMAIHGVEKIVLEDVRPILVKKMDGSDVYHRTLRILGANDEYFTIDLFADDGVKLLTAPEIELASWTAPEEDDDEDEDEDEDEEEEEAQEKYGKLDLKEHCPCSNG